jgi:hypothetical protein
LALCLCYYPTILAKIRFCRSVLQSSDNRTRFLIVVKIDLKPIIIEIYRVLRRIFGPKMDEVTGNGENYIMKS